MKTYKIVVEVTADEADRLLDTENVRLALGHTARDFRFGSAPITSIRIDGRDFDMETRTLEQTPINADIANEIAAGHYIWAIKMLREQNEGMSLMEAKTLVDKWRVSR